MKVTTERRQEERKEEVKMRKNTTEGFKIFPQLTGNDEKAQKPLWHNRSKEQHSFVETRKRKGCEQTSLQGKIHRVGCDSVKKKREIGP